MDMVMPEHERRGRRARDSQLDPKARIVMCSAHGPAATRPSGACRREGFITKPFTASRVLEALDELVMEGPHDRARSIASTTRCASSSTSRAATLHLRWRSSLGQRTMISVPKLTFAPIEDISTVLGESAQPKSSWPCRCSAMSRAV
jgi:hypothetical protein